MNMFEPRNKRIETRQTLKSNKQNTPTPILFTGFPHKNKDDPLYILKYHYHFIKKKDLVTIYDILKLSRDIQRFDGAYICIKKFK